MARIRSVWPEICASSRLAELSAELERTFVRLWTYLDDQGRGRDDARLIKSAIYPQHDDQTWQVIEKELAQLARAGFVLRWVDGDRRYLACRPESWDEFQHPQHPRPSTCPTPPGYVEVSHKRVTQREPYHSSGACARRCTVKGCSAISPENVRKPPEGVRTGVGVGVGVGEGVGDGEGVVASATPSQTTRAARKTAAPDEFPVDDDLRQWASNHGLGSIDLEAQTELFLNHHGAKGSLMVDWRRAWMTWMGRTPQFHRQPQRRENIPASDRNRALIEERVEAAKQAGVFDRRPAITKGS